MRRRQWQPTPVLLPGKSHGRRCLVGCSPWGREESDTTERLHFFHLSLSCTGEGNGNSLQCSCLENPSDGGAWWAAVYGVTQSRTRPKWLSSILSKYTKILEPKDLNLEMIQQIYSLPFIYLLNKELFLQPVLACLITFIIPSSLKLLFLSFLRL